MDHMEQLMNLHKRQARAFTALLPMLLVVSLSGCATWSRETVAEESVYQASHILDSVQTLEISRTPGYYEVQSRWAIGRHPTETDVYAYMGAVAIGHALLTDYFVSRGAPPWLLRAWEAVTIGMSTQDVAHNYNIGLRF